MPGKEPVEQITKDNPWYTVDHVSASKQRRQRLVITDRVRFITGTLESWGSLRTILNRAHRPRGEDYKLRILDAGCGDGVLLKPLTYMTGFFEVYGIDYNPARVKRARENAPLATVHQADLTQPASMQGLGFRDKFFDAIVMSQVLEHITEDATVLKIMAGLLSEDGIFILGVPNEGCLLGRIRNKVLQPSIARTTDHVNFYTESSVLHKLAQAGFVVDRVERTGFLFPHEAINILLASWKGGYEMINLLGKAIKSQVAGYHFVCRRER